MKHRAHLAFALCAAPFFSTLVAGCAPIEDGTDETAESLASSSTTSLRIEGTLTLNRCYDSENGSCGTGGFRPRSESATVTFASGNETRKVVPGARVRVGPFHLRNSTRDLAGDGLATPARYVVRLMARSPALYEPVTGGGSRFVGADAGFREIARRDVTITLPTGQQDVYLDAVLPSVFTALRVDAEIVGYPTRSYPSGCGSLSATSASAPATLAALDDACVQAVVTPTGVLRPSYLPVSIMYEPPGNCSWSNLTNQNIAGSLHAVTQETDTQTTVLRDVGPFWDRQHTEQWSRNTDATRRALELRVGLSTSVGTRLGLPLASPGDPRCNQPGTVIPARVDAGPGRGDVFVLLKNPDLLAWSTGGASNVTMRPGGGSNLVVVNAYQIATGAGLPPGVTFSDADRRALLALDPFIHATDALVRDALGRVTDVRLATAPTLVTPRYVFLDHVQSVGAGLSIEHTLTQQMQLSTGQTLSLATRDRASSTTGDAATALVMSGVEKAAGGLVSAVGSLVPVPGFGALAGSVIDNIFPLYVDTTTRNVVTTLTATSLHERLDASTVAQQFHIQDSTQGVSVELYYDRLFGTYVFRRMTAGTGFMIIPRPTPIVINPPVIRLP